MIFAFGEKYDGQTKVLIWRGETRICDGRNRSRRGVISEGDHVALLQSHHRIQMNVGTRGRCFGSNHTVDEIGGLTRTSQLDVRGETIDAGPGHPKFWRRRKMSDTVCQLLGLEGKTCLWGDGLRFGTVKQSVRRALKLVYLLL